MILHLIQKSPFESDVFTQCTNAAIDGDKVLLMQDGVYGIQHNDILNSGFDIYALTDDIQARGLNISSSNITPINYEEFVSLCSKTNSCISWY
ncbi:sulfurtransferase complex subunit TusB [Oceaniserpentilla sp. 4NH20-0058]|uniref:sulfurtransferase complex subunit TusB n=1 Tax=Oceaniserpentilla sp. 4NH20-0058 TaxID=3127660 RepID=UPI003101EA87